MTVPADIAARMIEIRRALHRRPELSNEERETQAFIRRELESAGLAGIRAGTGLAVDIDGTGGPANRRIAIRADGTTRLSGQRRGKPSTGFGMTVTLAIKVGLAVLRGCLLVTRCRD